MVLCTIIIQLLNKIRNSCLPHGVNGLAFMQCIKHYFLRSCRRLDRNGGWFDTLWANYSEKQFKKAFRISRETELGVSTVPLPMKLQLQM